MIDKKNLNQFKCPLGLICEVEEYEQVVNPQCANWYMCEYYTISWQLPYSYETIDGINALVVDTYSAQVRFNCSKYDKPVSEMNNKEIDGSYYYCFPNESTTYIRRAVEKAGWADSVYLPNEENDYLLF